MFQSQKWAKAQQNQQMDTDRERLNSLLIAKFDHSHSNSPAIFKELGNFMELSNDCAIAIEVEHCGIHLSAVELYNYCQKIQRCKIEITRTGHAPSQDSDRPALSAVWSVRLALCG